MDLTVYVDRDAAGKLESPFFIIAWKRATSVLLKYIWCSTEERWSYGFWNGHEGSK